MDKPVKLTCLYTGNVLTVRQKAVVAVLPGTGTDGGTWLLFADDGRAAVKEESDVVADLLWPGER